MRGLTLRLALLTLAPLSTRLQRTGLHADLWPPSLALTCAATSAAVPHRAFDLLTLSVIPATSEPSAAGYMRGVSR